MAGINHVCMKCEFEEDCIMLTLEARFPQGNFVCENPIMRPAWLEADRQDKVTEEEKRKTK